MKLKPYRPVYFLPEPLLPEGFRYPDSYCAFAAAGKPSTGPVNEDWCVLDEDEIEGFLNYARKIVPQRRLVPFMRRNGEDGVACFDGESKDTEPRVWGFTYCVDIGWASGNLTFSEWLAHIPPEDEDES